MVLRQQKQTDCLRSTSETNCSQVEVLFLCWPAKEDGKQAHKGLTTAAAGLHSEGHEAVATRSVPPILGRFSRIAPSSGATIGLCSSSTVCSGSWPVCDML
jgi:hypothetical protein